MLEAQKNKAKKEGITVISRTAVVMPLGFPRHTS